MKILYCAIDDENAQTPKYNYQALSSILSLARVLLFRDMGELELHLVTNIPSIWHKFIHDIPLLLAIKINVLDSEQFTYRTPKHLKLVFILEMASRGEPFTFVDTDTVFLRRPVFAKSSIIKHLKFHSIDLIAVLECGATSLDCPTYNTGLLTVLGTKASTLLMQEWQAKYLKDLIVSRDSPSMADQPCFIHSFTKVMPKTYSLPDIHNLRCHPVYNSEAVVWSPVVMIHNHDISDFLAKALYDKGVGHFFKQYARISSRVNAQESDRKSGTTKEWAPRTISASNLIGGLG